MIVGVQPAGVATVEEGTKLVTGEVLKNDGAELENEAAEGVELTSDKALELSTDEEEAAELASDMDETAELTMAVEDVPTVLAMAVVWTAPDDKLATEEDGGTVVELAATPLELEATVLSGFIVSSPTSRPFESCLRKRMR